MVSQEVLLLVAALFLPLFPLSMVFNDLFDRVRFNTLRIVLLIIWPQIGLAIIAVHGLEPPLWMVSLALLTALIYGFRALVLREVSLWVSFMATSAWALMWLLISIDLNANELAHYALGFSLPLAMLMLLAGELQRRFGAAYIGLYGGIAETMPRLSGVFVITVLAVVATPLFPGFAMMLKTILGVSSDSFIVALSVSIVWLVWGWAGIRLLQGLIIGEPKGEGLRDLGVIRLSLYGTMLIALGIGGIHMIGGLS